MSGSTVFTPVISPASYDDMETIARLQFEAFLPSMAIERIIWPHGMTPDVLSSATEAKKHTFHRPHVRYVKITTTPDQQIVAFARWYIWTEDRPISDWQKVFTFQPDTTIASENLNVKAARLVYGMTDEMKKEVIRGSKCAYGCSGLVDAIPKFESSTIKRLREQGAIILGKTVPTQWANYRNPGRASGRWSAVGGQCLGPYHEEQDPSGSSSGSAVAASLGLCAAALGTESKLASTAVVSLKPTVGLTSRYVVYTVSEWQDTVGVLARSVCDAAHILTAIAGPDPDDPFTVLDPRDSQDVQKPTPGTDFARACMLPGLQGIRVAVPRHPFPNDSVVNNAFDNALEVIKSRGAIIVDNVKYSEFDSNFTFSDSQDWTLGIRVGLRKKSVKPINEGRFSNMLTILDMAESLACYKTNPEGLHTLSDVIEYTRKTAVEENEKWGLDEWAKYEELASGSRLADCSAGRTAIPSLCHANVGGCPTLGVPLGFFPEDTPVNRRQTNGLVSNGPNVSFGLFSSSVAGTTLP
ncbi:uncharacterized protein E0L32_009437 [Thyridium curvatum]|uniref:Amidase domain-containing protein n=1 Tax=Thyridium curvatum TaxID=1093900 RepID=A0A507ANR8_9PEZI|nr:uncharacterized protein E0L32_009437 [Thyridium curvatum]TPX09393.1 hypothetical protein E0L32_009437 [Thyridium curvatum]